MGYYLFPNETNETTLNEKYAHTQDDFNNCAFINYWIQDMFEFKIFDIKKDMIYFMSNQSIYFPSIRGWFELAVKKTGLTTFASTYVFANGDIGATLSQSFNDENNTMKGVIAYDIIPSSSQQNKNKFIRNMLYGDDKTNEEFDYLLLESSKYYKQDIEGLSSDLSEMVYKTKNDDDYLTLERKDNIKSEFKFQSFKDIENNDITFASYVYKEDLKYLFFSDIKLYKSRISGKDPTIEVVNKVGLIGSASVIENEIKDTEGKVTNQLLLVTFAIYFSCSFVAIMISIVASRYFADNIMDEIINLKIKMRIIQNTSDNMKKMQIKNQKIEFSKSFYKVFHSIGEGSSDFDNMLKKFENDLIIFKIKSFVLSENNDRNYNREALIEFKNILSIYESSINISQNYSLLFRVEYADVLQKIYK